MTIDQPRPEQPDPVLDIQDETAPIPLEAAQTSSSASDTIQFDRAPTATTSFTPPAKVEEAATVEEAAKPAVARRPALRVGTVVWGLVLAVIGAGVIAAAAGYEFDLELASIALLALAGIGLVVGSIATSARRRSR